MDGETNEKIEINKIVALFISAALVAVFIVGGYYIFLKCAVPEQGPPALKEGAYSDVSKFVRLYIGLTNVTVDGAEFRNGEWVFNVSAKGITAFDRFEVRTDANMTLASFRIAGKINTPNSPATYQEMNEPDCKTDKSVIDIYVDPYDPVSAAYFGMINSIADRFSDSATRRFHVVNPYTSTLEGYKWAILTSQYLVCVRNDSESSFIKMTECIFNEVNSTKTIMNKTGLDACVSAAGVGISNETLQNCVNDASIGLMTKDGELSLRQMGDISTRYVMFNCKYETFPEYLDVVMCHLEPDMPACKDVS